MAGDEIRNEVAIVAPIVYENYLSGDQVYRYHCEALALASPTHVAPVWSIAREHLADGWLTYPVDQSGKCNPTKFFKLNDGSGIVNTLDTYTWWATS